MCRRLIYLTSFVLLLVLAGNAVAQFDPTSITDGHVYLFENVGGNVPDDSANGHTANLIGSPQVVDGLKGKALQFNGTSDGVHIPDETMVNLSTHQNRTVIAIFQCADVTKPEKQVVYEEGGTTRGLVIYVHEGLVYTGGWNLRNYTPEWTGTFLSAPISSGAWYAVAMVLRDGTAAQEDDKFEMWMNGELIGIGPGAELRSRSDDIGIGYANSQTKFHDGNFTGGGSYFEGMVDEIWIINAALTQVELGGFVGEVWPYAFGPTPADGALYEDTWVSLSWRPGDFAVSHDVYFGENFDDVSAGTGGTFRGNQTSNHFSVGLLGDLYPDGLAAETTYYWRIDEVEADGVTKHRGTVWRFFIPSSKAFSPVPPDGAESVAAKVTLTWAGGLGAESHTVYFGDDPDTVDNAVGGIPQTSTRYYPGALEFDETYYWRVDEFDGAVTHKGDVWSFTTMPADALERPSTVSTFHCIGVYWSAQDGSSDNVCQVYYRSEGSTEWKEALPLWYDERGIVGYGGSNFPYPPQYRGSIVNLEPGTTYEIELRLLNTGTTETFTASTWSEDFPIARTVYLPAGT
ncbi:MAG: LamG-like jellyroll fold domain-containing protein, partial [Planctomycetota bacterium]